MSWTLADIRTKARAITGRPSTAQMTDAKVDAAINDYYVHTLPDEITLRGARSWFSLSTAAGVGEYALDQDMAGFAFPLLLDDEPIPLYHDQVEFFARYPRDQETSAYYGTPESILLYGRILYLRPVPDDVYTLKVAADTRPEEMTSSTDIPIVEAWGKLIAYGAAIDILAEAQDFDAAAGLSSFYQYLLANTFRSEVKLLAGARSTPRY